MELTLTGRAALVTGGSKGLGLAVARNFAEAGADVAILARDAETLAAARRAIERTAKGKVAAFSCDVTRPDDIARAFDQVRAATRRLPITSRRGARRSRSAAWARPRNSPTSPSSSPPTPAATSPARRSMSMAGCRR
jgi:3-oxoacyl-[acyl-carrier protein] reductase